MIAGYGAPASVPVNAETFETLLRGCHEAAALEKALETLAWMHAAGVDATDATVTHVSATVDISQVWDKKAFSMKKEVMECRGGATPRTLNPKDFPSTMLHGALTPQDLRPAPHDGKRAIYVQRPEEQLQVCRCPCPLITEPTYR